MSEDDIKKILEASLSEIPAVGGIAAELTAALTDNFATGGAKG